MEEKDLELTFQWRNDPEVLKNAQTTNQISYKEHEAHFKFNSAVKLVFDIDGQSAGFLACTKDPDQPVGEWSFHMSSYYRGQGLSEIMLRIGLYYLKHKEGYQSLTSRVAKHNSVSKHLHYKLGFKTTGDKHDFFEYEIKL